VGRARNLLGSAFDVGEVGQRQRSVSHAPPAT
jgi:hypothetical protein